MTIVIRSLDTRGERVALSPSLKVAFNKRDASALYALASDGRVTKFVGVQSTDKYMRTRTYVEAAMKVHDYIVLTTLADETSGAAAAARHLAREHAKVHGVVVPVLPLSRTLVTEKVTA